MFDLSEPVLKELLEAISSSLGRRVALTVASASKTGESSPILRVALARSDGTTESAAVRLYPEGHPSAGDSDVTKEFDVLRTAAAGGVAVATPFGHGTTRVGGRRFDWLLTAWIDGQVPDPFARADAAQIKELRDHHEFRRDFVRTLARIHALPLPEPRTPDATPMAMARSELHRWRDVLDHAGFLRTDPVAAYAATWLERMLPVLDGRRPTRFHGDYRLGNLIIHDNRIAAVLDWEFCGVGDGLYDLGWLASPSAQVNALASGVISKTELVDAYERETGSSVDRRCLQLLTVLATFKNMATWVKLASVPPDVPGPNAWRLRRITSAVRVRQDLLSPIFAGPDRFLEPLPPSAVATGLFSAVADEAAPIGGSDTAVRAVSALRSILRHLSDRRELKSILDLGSASARHLQAAGIHIGSPAAAGTAFAAMFDRKLRGAQAESLFTPSGPGDSVCGDLLRQWSSIPAALIGCDYAFWEPTLPRALSDEVAQHG
jgi:aminoglycoside phosphotransferase (APT) family kinase protein